MPSLFLDVPLRSASGRVHTGRLTCPDIQWTGGDADLFGTFTITANELTHAAESGLLWTDQDVQRGIKPEANSAPRELSLADGYPDPKAYVFSQDNADDMVEKLLYGKRLFLSPLVWNLRPGTFKAYRDNENSSLHLYEGHIYIPDSHHRQQAIIKATKIWRETPREYPLFSGDKQFKVELYFLSREDEGNYFFDKNQRPTPTAKSKAFDLTTEDALSLLAKQIIEHSAMLRGNVNRVTDRLSAGNPQVITLSTLREMMKTFLPAEALDPSAITGASIIAAEFYDLLAEARPELGHLDLMRRRQVRSNLIVDAAVMMHGYASLMRAYNLDLAKEGTDRARARWRHRTQLLSASNVYHLDGWSGDLFEKRNPLWMRLGIVKPGRDGSSLTVINTGATRSESGRALRQLLALGHANSDLAFLVGN